MTAWMAIETAPMDATDTTPVLLWGGDKIYLGHWVDEIGDDEDWEPACFLMTSVANFARGDFYFSSQTTVTHWMPLPSSPFADDAEALK